MNSQYRILDDKGTIWASSAPDAYDEGLALMSAVENGDVAEYAAVLSTEWSGDLVFVRVLACVA